MSTDVVVFRTERLVSRVGVSDGRARADLAPPAPEPRPPGSIEEIGRGPGPIDGSSDGSSDSLAERLAAARARLGQLTFYLLDPESWR